MNLLVDQTPRPRPCPGRLDHRGHRPVQLDRSRASDRSLQGRRGGQAPDDRPRSLGRRYLDPRDPSDCRRCSESAHECDPVRADQRRDRRPGVRVAAVGGCRRRLRAQLRRADSRGGPRARVRAVLGVEPAGRRHGARPLDSRARSSRPRRPDLVESGERGPSSCSRSRSRRRRRRPSDPDRARRASAPPWSRRGLVRPGRR